MTEPAERTELRAAGEGAATAGVASGPALTPPEFDCGKCGYDLSGMPVRRCPECGWVFGEQEMEEGARRAMAPGLVNERVRTLLRESSQLLGAVFLLAVLLTGELATPIYGLLMGAAALGGSWAVGWMATGFAKEKSRPVLELAWSRSVLWLATPWLAAPVAVAGVWWARQFASVLPQDYFDGLSPLVFVIFVVGLWAICGIRGLVVGTTRFRQTCSDYCARPGVWMGVFTLVLALNVVVSIAMAATFFASGVGFVVRSD